MNGERRGINGAIDAFNGWFDVFVIAVAKPLAMLGFAMGTVDIFTRGGLATQYWFALAWSVVQAVTIDGLFFAVWYRVFDLKWERGNWRQISALLFIGAVLSVVAFTTNAILGYQQLWGLTDSQQAMVRLGIDPQQFTLLRAVLVVAVAVMIAYVYRTANASTSTSTSEPQASTVKQGKPENEQPMSTENRSQADSDTLSEQDERPGERVSAREHTQQYSVSTHEQDERSQATGVPLNEQTNERNEQESERNEHTQPLGVSGSEQTLSWIEQKMYDALLTNPDEAADLLKMAKAQNLPTFTRNLQKMYPGYASYITEGRVANVLRYAREREQVASRTTTDDLEGYRPGVPVSREVFLAELADNPALSLSEYASKRGMKYSTLTRWRREASKSEAATD